MINPEHVKPYSQGLIDTLNDMQYGLFKIIDSLSLSIYISETGICDVTHLSCFIVQEL